VPAAQAGDLSERTLRLQVNGELRQQSTLDQMIWNVADIVHDLSTLYALRAGDLIYTGTPAGVAALLPGDAYVAEVEGLGTLRGRVLPAASASVR
jgi:2-keto-4-pentenoate hydratase/2-oxohepta-3-ene-1,7-dioic acid hydratase in catechol pathway